MNVRKIYLLFLLINLSAFTAYADGIQAQNIQLIEGYYAGRINTKDTKAVHFMITSEAASTTVHYVGKLPAKFSNCDKAVRVFGSYNEDGSFNAKYISSQCYDLPEMADGLRQSGKIYVLVITVVIIMIGVILFLINTDRKVERISKELSE